MKYNTKELEKILKALASKRRLDVLKYLKRNREASVSEIAKEIKLSLKATSKHLRILYAINLLERENRNLMVYYQIAYPVNNPIVEKVLNYL